MEKIDLIGVNQAARILNKAPQTVRRYERHGKLPAYRGDGEGEPRVFNRGDVERLARELEQKSA